MDDIDNKIKNTWNKMRGPVSELKSGNCPGDEVITSYIDGRLEEAGRESVEQHLLECGHCSDLVLLYKETGVDAVSEALPDAPAFWNEKAKKLFASKEKKGVERVLDIILQLTKQTIEVISNPGSLPVTSGAMPVPVRSEDRVLSPNLVKLRKIFSDTESEVEVERIDDLHVSMKVRTTDIHSGRPVKILRISLLNPRRELASYITDSGEVSFGNLSYGEYEIKIIRDREEIGQISLNITLSAN